MLKLVFMGTPDFAAVALKALIEAKKYEILSVITQPDRPKGRGQKLQPSPVKVLALDNEISVYQPEVLDTDEGYEYLKDLAPDLVVVAAYGQLLSTRLLELPRLGCINVHASLLPRYRGAAPIHRSIIDGNKETGVTIMKMELELDAGDMYQKIVVPIGDDDTLETIHDKLAVAGGEVLLEVIEKLENGTAKAEKQDASLTTYAEKITKAETKIDWAKPARAIHDLVRGTNPFPGAFTFYAGKRWKIHRTQVLDVKENLAPGQMKLKGQTLLTGTGDGILELIEIQPENSKRMKVNDYLRGHQIDENVVLGNE